MAKSKVDAYNLMLIGLHGSGIEYGNYIIEDLKFQSTKNLDVYLRRNNPEEQHTGFLFNDKILYQYQFQKTTNITFYYPVEDGGRIKVNSDDTSCDSISHCYYSYRDFIHFYAYGPDFCGKMWLSEYPDLKPEELDIFNSLSVSLENYCCFDWLKSLEKFKRRDLTMYIIREHRPTKSNWDYEFRLYLWATKIGTKLYLGNSPEQSKLGIGFSLPWFYYKNIKENETKRLDLLCSIS